MVLRLYTTYTRGGECVFVYTTSVLILGRLYRETFLLFNHLIHPKEGTRFRGDSSHKPSLHLRDSVLHWPKTFTQIRWTDQYLPRTGDRLESRTATPRNSYLFSPHPWTIPDRRLPTHTPTPDLSLPDWETFRTDEQDKNVSADPLPSSLCLPSQYSSAAPTPTLLHSRHLPPFFRNSLRDLPVVGLHLWYTSSVRPPHVPPLLLFDSPPLTLPVFSVHFRRLDSVVSPFGLLEGTGVIRPGTWSRCPQWSVKTSSESGQRDESQDFEFGVLREGRGVIGNPEERRSTQGGWTYRSSSADVSLLSPPMFSLRGSFTRPQRTRGSYGDLTFPLA